MIMKKTRNIFPAAGKLMTAILLLLSSIDVMAANGIIETRTYKICPGDTITVDTRQTVVYRDTVLFDTIRVLNPAQDSIYVYVVNTYPPFLNYQERTIERGTSFDWYGRTISHAGMYEQIFKSTISGCDSTYRIVVRERVETSLTETLCEGNTISFGGKTISTSGIYRDTIHYSDYDSVIIMSLNVVKPDTTTTVSRIPEGSSTIWNGETYTEAGVYDKTYPNRFGCDSLSRLIVTTYHVDTIDTAATICPSETLTWHGMTYGQTGRYEFPGVRTNGDRVYYRLNLTVLPLQEVERTFTLCDEESVTFNGKTYVNAGTYFDYLSCDTLCKIVIGKYPTQLHEQTGTLDATHPYYWRYSIDGVEQTDTISQPGVYQHVTHNVETGCNDIWRLILTKDETRYHFLEEATVCESEPFSWRGRNNLNRTGIGQTTHYYDRYKTAEDQDSIYELVLTVYPVLRTMQTIPFCGSVTYNGVTYTESFTAIDTLVSARYHCDSIVTTILAKGIPFLHHDTITIYPGETLEWRGRSINQDGYYEDRYTSVSGCDSIYSISVGLKEIVPSTKSRTYRAEICADDYYEWRGEHYFNTGTYVDTVFVGTTEVIDSLHILVLTVHPKYASRERITFHSFPATYRGHVFHASGEEFTFTFTTVGGCDSIVTVVAERELTRTEEWELICPNETFIWQWDGRTYSEPGTYVQTIKDATGKDSVEHILHLTVRYIPDTYITKTICQGGSYTFGDRTLTTTGNYTYTFHNSGCDSTVHLSLNVVNADTMIYMHHMDEGQHYVWNNTTYYEPGVYYHYATNRFGCDSVSILELTVNQVDTIDTTITVCQNELPVIWHGIRANQSGDYTAVEQQAGGQYVYYRLHLTVREIVQIDTTFTICADASVSFNGQTYTAAGHYRDYLTCDTLMNVHIVVLPQQVYETKASLGGEHGYTWTYRDSGIEKTQTFSQPGTYEFESPNATTGCSELWRLILTKDETEYHFVETISICEGDDFTWRNLTGLSHQGIGETSHYYDSYQTRTGKDSIYELVLTVMPVERTVRTITFCGSIAWDGITYTSSAVVYDTISLASGCYRIERINLDKAMPFYSYEAKELPQGQVLNWHGRTITTDGIYRDEYTTIYGCDSIYEIAVTIIPATPETNQYAEELSVCEGDTILWRDRLIWRGGTYVDTVWSAGHSEIDSIFTLRFTVWPAPKDTIHQHLYTCGAVGAAIRYQGKDYYADTVLVNTFPTIHGCDSTVKVYLHFNTSLFLTDTVEIADTELPYTWHYRLGGVQRDTVLTRAGTYNHIEIAEGGCYNQEQIILLVYPTYLYELDTTVCEMDLPFHWLSGPAEHVNDALQHAIGQTKQYEYRYQTVNHTDSIYRLHLTIEAAPKRTQSIYLCAGEAVTLENGRTYFNLESDRVYRDTISKPNTGTICDSIIFYEIYQYPVKEHIQTIILQQGDSYDWNGQTITQGGIYHHTTYGVGVGGCDSVSTLRVIQEMREEKVICTIDTAADTHPDKKYPYLWPKNNKTYTTSGIWTDTIYDAEGFISEYHTLYLTITQPYDTTIYVHGCQDKGAVWRDYIYWKDTAFVERVEVNPYTPQAPCDSVFHVNIVIDTVYQTVIDTVICETQLPFVLGRHNPILIWEEHVDPITINDTTACGCDSTITLKLRITPTLSKNDSTFVCEDFFRDGGYVYLGDTVHPWFDNHYHGQWEGKWHGVGYNTDTIVWDCDSTYFHHIIMRPRQAQVVQETYLLCQGDSVQLFWPYDDKWIYQPGVYLDTIQTNTPFVDSKHGYVHNDRDYLCDSIVQWTVLFADTLHEDTTVHIAMGDSLFWNNHYYYTTGSYDSIGFATDTNSLGEYCKYVKTLHLYVDSTYYFRDTLELCELPGKEILYTWQDGYSRTYTLPTKDTALHVIDRLPTMVYRFDSIYDLYIDYRVRYITQIYDTICEGTELRFDAHHHDNTLTQRYLTTKGIYYDTIPAINGCDSVIILYLETRDSIPLKRTQHMVSDRDLPYLWSHTWHKADGSDTTHVDTLRATGEYRYTMPSIYGCDSTVILDFIVHQTHLFRDTIEVCALANKTLTHLWSTGYKQTYTVPDHDQNIHYYDTLSTRIKLDSIYDLYVLYHEETMTYLDMNLCYGDSVQFGLTKSHQPRFISKTGIYRDTLVRYANGCDSIIEMRLNVFPRYFNAYTHHVSDSELPFVWEHIQHGVVIKKDTLYADGEYIYHYTNEYGCDSIDSLSLRVHATYLYRDTVTICQDETPYAWQGILDIYSTGEYIKNLQTHDGYDSTHVRFVRVIPIPHDTIRHEMCEGADYLFNGVRYYQNGTYSDTLTSSQGCDSIVTLVLKVNKPVYVRIPADIYEGEYYSFYGENYTTSGTYRHYGQTPDGCDSITELFLTVHPQIDTTVILCSNELPYIWINKWSGEARTLYSPGLYRNDTTYVNGQRTFYSLQLIVNEPKQDTVRASICRGSSYLFKGLSLTETGNYRDTVQASNGCDSVITLILTVNDPYYHYRVEHILEGQSVTFFGNTYTETGTFTHYGHTPNGCDSTSVLQLIVHPLVDTVVTICTADLPYQWVNKWNGTVTPLYTAGLYRNDTTYVNGEKMYYGLQLVVNQPVDTALHVSICDGTTYYFNNQQLTTGGEYRDTLVAANGCDSVVILHLNVNPLYHHIVNRHIFEGDTVIFQDQVYNLTGRYPYRYTSSTGCDSIIELNLTVSKLFDDSVTVCANELPLLWRNKTLYQSGIYRDTTYDSEGTLTITGLKVNVLPIARNVEPLTVTICEGDYYQFGDTLLGSQGVYYDTLTAANGCDSIVALSLQVQPLEYQTEHKRIFEGDSAFFNGTWLKESGVYEYRTTNSNNCASVHQFVLTVLKTFNIDTTAYVCVNELPFIWHGYEFNETGDYSLPTAWTDSSRVVTTLHLNVRETFYGERNVKLCQGNVFIFNRDTFMTSGVFYDTIPALNGCDSIIKYIVSMHPTYEHWDTVHISDKQTYRFGDRDLMITGDYESSALTSSGCDSIAHLHLVVHPSYYFKEALEICQPDTCKWHGQLLTESGTYFDKQLTTHYGFDSIYELQLVVHPAYFTYEQYLINDGETTILHGINITKTDSIYTDTLHTVYGCDSIFQIAVNSKRTIQVKRDITICANDYYQFYDRKLTKAGVYSKIVQTAGQMDSLITITLAVNPVSLNKERIVLTEEELPYIYNGHFYDPAVPTWNPTTRQWEQDVVTTIIEDTLYNIYGCDSITRLEFVVTTHYSEWAQIPLCTGEQLIIDKDTIHKAGFYTFVRRSLVTNKLDSLYRVEVYEAPAYEMPPVKAAICEGEDTLFAGHRYSKNGTHVVHLATVDGCDSIVTLELTVNPSYHFHKYVRIWPSEVPYIWEGRGYYNSGDYNMAWQKGNCDSIWSLHLTVVETDTIRSNVTVCEGDYYTFYGDTLRRSGTYAHLVTDSVNKIATLYLLNLKMSGPITIVDVHTEPVCAGDKEFDIFFSYQGQKPTTYSVYFDTDAKVNGFLNVYDQPLTSDSVAHIALPEKASPNYLRPDYYKMQLILDNGTCGNASRDNISLLVQYPDWIIQQNWDDVVAPLNSQYNGGYEFTQTEWYVNNTLATGTELGYLHDDNLKEGDIVFMRAMRKGESYFIPTCPIEIGKMPNLTPTPVILSPNYAPRHAPYVTIVAPADGTYELFSATGMLLSTGEFYEGKTTLMMPNTKGIYILCTAHQDTQETHKVIIY